MQAIARAVQVGKDIDEQHYKVFSSSQYDRFTHHNDSKVWVSESNAQPRQPKDDFLARINQFALYFEINDYLKNIHSQENQEKRTGIAKAFHDSCLNQEQTYHSMNLLGYMLSKQSWQDDALMNKLLQTMLQNFTGQIPSVFGEDDEEKEESEGEEDAENKKMLVFKDLDGKLW